MRRPLCQEEFGSILNLLAHPTSHQSLQELIADFNFNRYKKNKKIKCYKKLRNGYKIWISVGFSQTLLCKGQRSI